MINIEIFLLGLRLDVLIILGAAFLLLAFLLAKGTYIVNQSEVVIIERLGKFKSILHPGIHFVIPFLDAPHSTIWTFTQENPYGGVNLVKSRHITRIDLRESVYDFPRQNVITKDNVTMEINALLYYQITDPKRAAYEVNNLPMAIEKLTQTTLRNVIGAMDLDETLISRDQINEKLRLILDEATDKWGVKVNRVELQEVSPPKDIRHAMEQQMRAERNRRAHILDAEGKKRAEILEAEGEKQAQIERAKGEAEAKHTIAIGEKNATIERASGEAEAIKTVMNSLGESKNSIQYIIATRYIKMLPELLKGKDGKTVVLPYESSALMGSISSIKELFEGLEKKKPKD